MTEEQRNQFRKTRKAIEECRSAIYGVRDTFGRLTPRGKTKEWNRAYTALFVSLRDLEDLVEAEENLQILQTLPERE